jgi:DNA repair protein RadC
VGFPIGFKKLGRRGWIAVVKSGNKHGGEGHRSRLRRKFLQHGFGVLCPHEVLELILTLSIPRQDVKGKAKELLDTFGSIGALFDAPVERLMEISGIGESTATAFQLIRTANGLYLQGKLEMGVPLDTLDGVKELWRSRLGSLAFEVVEVAYLDAGLRLMMDGIERLETGTVAATTIYPRKVAEAAIRHGCVAVIVAHNHPAGPITPSNADERMTNNLKTALKTLDIVLVDHIIVSSAATFSFKENGLL